MGYNYAILRAWILEDGFITNNPPENFTVSISWDTNSQDGDFTAIISLAGTTDPSLKNYSIIIGFDGTLGITEPDLSYNAAILATNATELEFTVYDKPNLDTLMVYDTVGWGFIVGGTNLTISGTLYYSNSTAVPIAGQTITIKFYDSSDGLLDTQVDSTDASGDYLLSNYLMLWDIAYYTVSYGGDDTNNLDAANTITEPLVE